MVADGELQRIMAQVDLDGNNTLDFQASVLALSGKPSLYITCATDMF